MVPGPAALTVLGPDGSVRWEAPPTAGFVSATQRPPATASAGVHHLRRSGQREGWDLESGAPLWSAVLPDSQAGGDLAIVDGVALVTTAGGLSAFDGRSGAAPTEHRREHGRAVQRRGRPQVARSSRRTVTVTAPGCPTPGGY